MQEYTFSFDHSYFWDTKTVSMQSIIQVCYNYIVMTKFNLCSSAVIYKRWQTYHTPATTAVMEILFVEKIPWAVLHLIFLSWPWFRCQFIFSSNIIVSTGHYIPDFSL